MVALQGYYDGNAVRTLEHINAKKNQKLIITVLDEFLEEKPEKKKTSVRGALRKYADATLRKEEEGAWEQAVVDEHDNN